MLHKELMLFLIFIFCFDGIANSCEDAVNRPTQERSTVSVRSSVWIILEQNYVGGDTRQYGTGFFIAPNKFITNFHVIAGVPTVKGVTLLQKGNSRPLKVRRVLAVSALYDLALLETVESVNDYLGVRKGLLREEEDLFITGYAGANLIDVRKTGDPVFLDDSVILPISSTLELSGLSGSAVVDANKKVIGVLYGGIGNFIFTVRLDHLKEFVGSGLRYRSTKTRNLGQILRTTVKNLKNLAGQGNVQAQYALGRWYMPKSKEPEMFQSYEKAFEYYKQSADQGHISSQHMVGAMYYNGNGVAQNYGEAVNYYTKSAKQGYAPAQTNLARMLFAGEGVPQNYEEALYWLRQGAKQGFVIAQEMLDKVQDR